MSTQVAADLRAAAEVLRRDGWAQGGLNQNGRHCVVEAVFEVSPTVGTAAAATGFLRSSVIHQKLTTWNDAPGRTADEVIDALEAAATAAEAEQ